MKSREVRCCQSVRDWCCALIDTLLFPEVKSETCSPMRHPEFISGFCLERSVSPETSVTQGSGRAMLHLHCPQLSHKFIWQWVQFLSP